MWNLNDDSPIMRWMSLSRGVDWSGRSSRSWRGRLLRNSQVLSSLNFVGISCDLSSYSDADPFVSHFTSILDRVWKAVLRLMFVSGLDYRIYDGSRFSERVAVLLAQIPCVLGSIESCQSARLRVGTYGELWCQSRLMDWSI